MLESCKNRLITVLYMEPCFIHLYAAKCFSETDVGNVAAASITSTVQCEKLVGMNSQRIITRLCGFFSVS